MALNPRASGVPQSIGFLYGLNGRSPPRVRRRAARKPLPPQTWGINRRIIPRQNAAVGAELVSANNAANAGRLNSGFTKFYQTPVHRMT